jgi:GNAT superfamily N-acetyltransferase
VAERGYVGLYDIVVAPSRRGLGLGRRLVASLMAWGRDQGAARAYLQMREANTVAASLYANLGFETAYRYTHRVLAAPG